MPNLAALRARTCYFAILERTWGGGVGCPPPRRFAPVGARASGQKPADSLGCCESNGTRFYPFRAYLDLPRSSQTKKDRNLRLFCFVLFFVNNFWTKHARGMILAPSCFSRRAASKYVSYDPYRSNLKVDLRSRSRGDLMTSSYYTSFRSGLTRQTQWYHSRGCISFQ